MYHLSSKCSRSGHIWLCSNKSQVLLGGCSSLAFSRGSAERHAKGLHALTRLREENNTSCCTELGRSHVLPWAGCWWAQGLPASLLVSSCKSWHAARSMSWLFTSWWKPLSSQAGLQDCLPTIIAAQIPTRSTNAMGTTERNRSSTTVPLQEIAVPSGTEGASPCSGLPTWPLCSAAMPTLCHIPCPTCWDDDLSPAHTHHFACIHGFQWRDGHDCCFQFPQQCAISAKLTSPHEEQEKFEKRGMKWRKKTGVSY